MLPAFVAMLIAAGSPGAGADAIRSRMDAADAVLSASAGQQVVIVRGGDGRLRALPSLELARGERETYVLAIRDGSLVAVFHELRGDGDLAHDSATHYFDDEGRTIAFRRTTARRKAQCLDAVTPPIFVTSVRTFDERGAVLSRTDDVRDALGVELRASECTLPPAASYAIRRSARELGEAELRDGPE